MSRRKNPHPKRAVNARTVLKVAREEPLVLCSKIPDEDDDFPRLLQESSNTTPKVLLSYPSTPSKPSSRSPLVLGVDSFVSSLVVLSSSSSTAT